MVRMWFSGDIGRSNAYLNLGRCRGSTPPVNTFRSKSKRVLLI